MAPNLAFEAHAGVGVVDDTVNVSVPVNTGNATQIVNVPVDTEIKSFYGAYLRIDATLVEGFKAYGLAGYTYGRGKATVRDPSTGELASFGGDEEDVSCGIGFEQRVDGRAFANLEVMQLIDRTGFEFSSISVGVRFPL